MASSGSGRWGFVAGGCDAEVVEWRFVEEVAELIGSLSVTLGAADSRLCERVRLRFSFLS